MAASPQVSAKLRAFMARSSARRSWSLERVTRRKLSMSASPMRIVRAVVIRLVVGTPSMTVPPAALKGGGVAGSFRREWGGAVPGCFGLLADVVCDCAGGGDGGLDGGEVGALKGGVGQVWVSGVQGSDL